MGFFSARRSAALALGGYLLLALLVAWPTLAGRSVIGPDALLDWDPLYSTSAGPVAPLPLVADLTPIVLDYPRDLAFARGLHAGRLDLWNPLAACGAPLWAEQGGPFFPLKLPFYLFPSRATYDVFLALRLAFAAFGAYLLARAHGLSPLAAFASGGSFALSGILIAQLPFAAASPAYTLPWVVLGATAITRRPHARTAAAAAIALAVAGSGGHPPLVLLDFVAFALAVAVGIAGERRRPRRALGIAAWSLAATILALGLAAPTLLPLAELSAAGNSYKLGPGGLLARDAATSRARAFLALALFAPRSAASWLPVTHSLLPFGASIGVLGITTAAAAILRRGLSAPLAALLLAGLVLALVPPGFGWLAHLPGIALILPSYTWSLCALALTQALGRGVEEAGTRGGRRMLIAVLTAVIGWIAAALLLGERVPALGLRPRSLGGPAGLATVLLGPLIAVAAAALSAAAARTRARWPAGAVLACCVLLDQLTTMLPLTRQPAARALSSPATPAVRFLHERLASGQERIAGVSTRVGHPQTPMLFGLRDQRGVSALPVRRFRDYLDLLGSGDAPMTVQAAQATASPLLDLAAVRYVVVATPVASFFRLPAKLEPGTPPEADAANRLVHQDELVLIYENQAALPRARIVHRAVAAPDPQAALDWMRAAAAGLRHAGDGALADRVVVEDEGRELAPLASGPPRPQENVRIVDQSDPDRLLLEARLAEPGLVVVADTYYPGWKAWVDGEPAPIFPADVMFRAIPAAAGAHTIELAYAPASLRYGVLAFAIASLAVAVLAFGRRRRIAPLAACP